MTSQAERTRERTEHNRHLHLLDDQGNAAAPEDVILFEYLYDAYKGTDPDWASSDDNRNSAALIDVQAVLRSDEEPAEKLARIRSIINAVQVAAGMAHVEALKRKGAL